MKNRSGLNPFLRLFGIVGILVITAIAVGIGMFYYTFAVPEPGGLSLASWPDTFTDNFSIWLECESGEIKVEDIGIRYLDEYGLWLQIVDESGREVLSYHKPDRYPVSYTASELMSFDSSRYENGHTVFTGSYENSGQEYGYLIGFPYAIGKHMIYYNGENVGRLSPIFRITFVVLLLAVFIVTLVYGYWLSKHLGRITKSIRDIFVRTYTPLAGKGMFGEVYTALNEMDSEIRQSDKVRKETERVRREWITNVTHDVKTPLSPIKGFAELLAKNPTPKSAEVQEYGEIILKNAIYTEKLINDLKMTYQFETGVIPITLQEVHLVRYIREIIIEIINDPAFSKRDVELVSTEEDMVISLDTGLFRRALENVIVNALIHNPPETKVTVRIVPNGRREVSIIVRDDGKGMSEGELSELFERYYRGTSTKEKPEGSGLGLAIAKQIVTLHGGTIAVKSKQNEGTEFTISLPVK